MSADFRLAVLNAGGRDPEHDYSGGFEGPGELGRAHPPVNFHAYAACTRGSFHAGVESAVATGRPILLLLRRDLKAGLRALRRLKTVGRTVAVTFKEAGAMQLAERLSGAAHVHALTEIVALADGCLAPAPWLAAFLGGFGKPTEFIPPPYPLVDPRWDFGNAGQARRGIFVGTREFGTPARQHLAALVAARELARCADEPVTVFNADGRSGAKILAALGFPDGALRVLTRRLPYPEYLREMAAHKLVFQLDRGGVPGQVAGDALLCRMPCVGGDGGTEQLAFAPWAGKSPAELTKIAHSLLTEPAAWTRAVADSQTRAAATIDNPAVAARLAEFFTRL